MSNFGIPYMGSKSSICKNICAIFPKADNFYDLFGGGFSITDCMIRNRSRDYKNFHFNEIRSGICDLIKDAIAGKYNYKVFKPKWISREEFDEKKEIDPYIKICWSFGNNGQDYLFGKDIEEYKRSMHNAVIFNEFNETALKYLGIKKFDDEMPILDRRLFLRNRMVVLNRFKDCRDKQQLQQLERLEQLQRLQQLERLQRLEQLYFYNESYDQIEIKNNSIIYCDIPYENTRGYDKNKSFNRKTFLDWADKQENPVFISEYQIKDDRFQEIYRIKKMSRLCSKSRECGTEGGNNEKLYANKVGLRKMLGK